jgi:hypothetical protein
MLYFSNGYGIAFCVNEDELLQMKLLSRFFPRKPVPRTEDEIASLIERFADDAVGRWEWDSFISTNFENEPINRAQKECLKVEEEFPRAGPVGWCNEQGLDRLRAIASELRRSAKKS